MATTSTMAVQHADGTVSQIYGHWDGYPSHNGRLLVTYYTDIKTVEEMISYGDISSLAATICPSGSHNFENPQKDVCVYYGRDRGETGTLPEKFDDIEMLRLGGRKEEYNYLFKDGKWHWLRGKEYVELSLESCKDD